MVPSGWLDYEFTEVFEDVSSGNVKTKQAEYLDSGRFPIVDQGQTLIAGYSNDPYVICNVELPVIVFGDHTRIIKYVDFPFGMGADGTKVLKPRIEADTKYLYYFLENLQIPNTGYNRHYKYLKRNRICVPPLAEQQRIAAILDKADMLRAKRRTAVARLDALLQSTFLHLFGDPVTNPMGWEVLLFDDVCDSRLGKMLDAKQQTGEHTHFYLRNANVQWDRFDLDDLLEMDFDEKERDKFQLQDGDLLICEGGEVGRAAIWRGQIKNCYYQKALHRARADATLATPEYLLFYMWLMAKNNGLKDHTTSVTIAHLTGIKLKKLPVPLPDLSMQQQFTQYYKKTKRLRDNILQGQQQLDNLFHALQQRAFKGEL